MLQAQNENIEILMIGLHLGQITAFQFSPQNGLEVSGKSRYYRDTN